MQELLYAITPCTLGRLLVAKSSEGICAALLTDNDVALLDELASIFPQASLRQSDVVISSCKAVLDSCWDAQSPFKEALDIKGTAFQQEVWRAICAIPRGEVLSYKALAQNLQRPKAVRAVASACAANHLALIVPCHRVVRSDGGLAGYRWGLLIKEALLKREQAECGIALA